MGATTNGMVETEGFQGQRELRLTRWSGGNTTEPVLTFQGGKKGYLWIGDGNACLFWLSTGEARRLRNMLNEELGE